MEFHINTTGSMPDLAAVEAAIATVDPAVVADFDHEGNTLRVAASVTAMQLQSLLRAAGCVVAVEQVLQVPSTCCGGCSG